MKVSPRTYAGDKECIVLLPSQSLQVVRHDRIVGEMTSASSLPSVPNLDPRSVGKVCLSLRFQGAVLLCRFRCDSRFWPCTMMMTKANRFHEIFLSSAHIKTGMAVPLLSSRVRIYCRIRFHSSTGIARLSLKHSGNRDVPPSLPTTEITNV